MDTTAGIGTLRVGINMPAAVKGDSIYMLPPYAPQPSYLVDAYPACPEEWERSRPGVISTFVGVKEERGLWLDFNSCWEHPHHVAIVPSVQGINPITGQHTKELALAQFTQLCPVHECELGGDRFCKECKYAWPKQNYICTTGTRYGMLWIDGFRSSDGIVRQYIVTESEVRSVAAAKIGTDRVWAIGIAFYISKEPKPTPPPIQRMRGGVGMNYVQFGGQRTNHTMGGGGHYSASSIPVGGAVGAAPATDWAFGTMDSGLVTETSASTATRRAFVSPGVYQREMGTEEAKSKGGIILPDAQEEEAPAEEVVAKRLEIGAGAQIHQAIGEDPNGLDFWKPEVETIVYVNYCSTEQAEAILKAGKRVEEREGFLAGVAVGNK